LILVVGCPIFLLIYWAIRLVSGRHDTPRTASWVVLILWLAGMFMFYSVGAGTFIRLHNHGGNLFSTNWSDDNKPFVDEIRKSEPFHAVEVSGNVELTLKDSTQGIIISCPRDFMPKVITKVENGVLHIYSEESFFNKTIKVVVPSDSINSIIAKGACNIKSKSQLVVSEFTLELLGASEADLNVKVAGLFKLDLKGASKVDLKGTSDALKISGLGASEVNAIDLIAKRAEVYVSGASHARLYATESLNAEAYGASEIDCKGSPKKVTKTDKGASSINVE